MNEDLYHRIRDKLWETREHCDYKRAWFPEGWTCVDIDAFAKELAEWLGCLAAENRRDELIEQAKLIIERIGTTGCGCEDSEWAGKASGWINSYNGWRSADA